MNSKKIFPFFWIFFIFLLQNAVTFLFPQKAPTLLLITVLFYALSEGPWFGALLGAFAGLLLEVFGLGRMGGEILVLSFAGFLFGQSAGTFFRESIFAQILLPVLAFYLTTFLRFVLFAVSAGEGVSFSVLRESCLSWDILGVLVVSPLIFFFLKKVSYGVSQG